MGRPPLSIDIAPKDQKELAKLLSGGVQQVRVVLRALALLQYCRNSCQQLCDSIRTFRQLQKPPNIASALHTPTAATPIPSRVVKMKGRGEGLDANRTRSLDDSPR
jgi:hypothetical protein